MLERLRTFVSAAGPAGLRASEQDFSGAACLVVAEMLMDAEFGEFIVSGVHPASGWTETGPASHRFASQLLSKHRQVAGERKGRPWLEAVGVPPWTAASQLSVTCRRTQQPTPYLWYPAWRRSGRALGLVVRSVRRERPALVYVGSHWRPRHLVLVVDADHESLSYYDPAIGQSRTATRSHFVEQAAPNSGRARPLFIVIPTGRRASI
jgi:hypothetical protein